MSVRRPTADEIPRLTLRPATEPGVSCLSCLHSRISWSGVQHCANHRRYLLPDAAHVSPIDKLPVCEVHEFGLGQSHRADWDQALLQAFLDERARLFELLVEPTLTDERRTEVISWLAQALP